MMNGQVRSVTSGSSAARLCSVEPSRIMMDIPRRSFSAASVERDGFVIGARPGGDVCLQRIAAHARRMAVNRPVPPPRPPLRARAHPAQPR